MAVILSLLAVVAGIGSIICWIIVLIKLFQNNQIALGIVSIFCGIVAFIMGWSNANQWNIKNVMIVWTICILVGIIAQVGMIGVAGAMNPQQL